MCLSERTKDLAKNVDRDLGFERGFGLQNLAKVPPGEMLEDHVEQPIRLAEVEHANDVWVFQVGENPHFAGESCPDRVRILPIARLENLQRNRFAFSIACPIQRDRRRLGQQLVDLVLGREGIPRLWQLHHAHIVRAHADADHKFGGTVYPRGCVGRMMRRMELPQVGTLFHGKYHLHEELGAGGFAHVFRATDHATRPVAIKIIRPSASGRYSDEIKARFMREVQAIARLRDEHTVRMFDYGESDTGLMFMVFEFLSGRDLGKLITERGRLLPDEVLHVAEQIARSLREAHACGLLHRDIKPQNVQIVADARDPLRAKLLDFGIAKSVTDQAGLTREGELIGTPRYMSPEQLLSGELGPASDIYSLGMVCFHALLGSDHMQGNTLGDQLMRLEGGPLFPSSGIRAFDAGLAHFLDKMTAREPRHRFQTADEVLAAIAALRRATSQPTASADIPLPTLRAPGAAAPKTNLVPIVAVSACFLVAAAAVTVMLIDEPGPQPRVIAAPVPPPPPPPLHADPIAEVGVTKTNPVVADVGVDAARPGCDRPTPFVGLETLTSTAGGIDARGTLTYIPSTYDPGVPSALLLMFHESAEAPARFFAYSRMQQIAEEHGVVVMLPHDMLPPWQGAWQDSGPVAGSILTTEALSTARAELCIDESRIFALGHAAGGFMVERMPCEFPEIAAIATTSFRGHAGYDRTACRPKRAIPYLFLAPLEDDYNPVAGGMSCSGNVKKISLKAHEDLWRTSHACEGRKRGWLRDENGNTCFTWDCDTPFITCHLDGGRNWPGVRDRPLDQLNSNLLQGRKNCDGTPANFDYGAVIWRFFAEHVPSSGETE